MATLEERELIYKENLDQARYYFDKLQWLLHEYAYDLGTSRVKTILKEARSCMGDLKDSYSWTAKGHVGMKKLFDEVNEEILLKKAEGKIGKVR